MRRPVRIIPFLILNIIVSAATVLIVLNWWSSRRPSTPLQPVVFPTEIAPTQPPALPTNTPRPNLTGTPAGEVRELQVVDVIGAGDAKNEVVHLKYSGEGELRLAGWKMEDNMGHRYTFPNYALGKGGTVRIYTRAGVDSATELFWGLAEAVWQTGKTVVIYDAQGAVRASFVVP